MKTYGTITRLRKIGSRKLPQWELNTEPHVMTKLARHFVQLRPAGTKAVLSDTLEVCRDLQWFTERYPLVGSSEDLEYLKSRSEERIQQEEEVDSLLLGNLTPRDFTMALPPRDYQKVAAELLLRTKGLLLADDVGLGKTCSAITAMSEKGTLPALVVTLTHLPKQWERELHRFLPGIKTHILKKGTPYDISKHLKGSKPDVIISNYHKLAGWSQYLAGSMKYVIFDEVQELRRGSDSQKGAAAIAIAERAEYVIGLSATPIYNLGSEIWNVLQPVKPFSLGTWSEFLREWCGDYNNGAPSKIRDPKSLGLHLRNSGLMLRRTREDVNRSLPPISVIPHYLESDKDELKKIESDAKKLAEVILSTTKGEKGSAMHASEELINMVRQATGVAKAPYVAAFVKMLLDSGEKVVLYGWHRSVYSIWEEQFKGYNPKFYTGSESTVQKDASKEAFMSGETNLLILSLRSGAGLDGLQNVCSTVVFGELDWSPGVHEQCVGRVVRDGQQKNAFVYYLLSDEGSDPIVSDALGLKSSQIQGIRSPNQDLIEASNGDPEKVKRLAKMYLGSKHDDSTSEPDTSPTEPPEAG